MSIKKNVVPINGGAYQVSLHQYHRGGWDASYRIIDKTTYTAYTNRTLLAELNEILAREPSQKFWVESLMPKLERKAAAHPDAYFTFTSHGKTEKQAVNALRTAHKDDLYALTHVLFGNIYRKEIILGNPTIKDYFRYVQPSMLSDKSKDTRDRTLGLIKNHLIPIIGDDKICTIAVMDAQKQADFCRGVEKYLYSLKKSAKLRSSIVRALRFLLEDIRNFGVHFSYTPYSLTTQIQLYNRENRSIRPAFVPEHLDDAQRTALFECAAAAPDNGYSLWLLTLIYCGFSPAELSAAYYRDIERIECADGICYTVLITGRMYLPDKRYARRSVLNSECNIDCLRRIVLSEHANALLENRIRMYYTAGYRDSQIGHFTLSADEHGRTINPHQIECLLNDLIARASLPSVTIPRRKYHKDLEEEKIKPDVRLILKDAKYVADTLCHLSTPMMDSMFGQELKTTEEKSYLDLFGVLFSLSRYHMQRRFFPFAANPAKYDPLSHTYDLGTAPNTMQLWLTAQEDTTVTIHSNYGIHAEWKGGIS